MAKYDILDISLLCPQCKQVCAVPAGWDNVLGLRRVDTAGCLRVDIDGIVNVTCCHCGYCWDAYRVTGARLLEIQDLLNPRKEAP